MWGGKTISEQQEHGLLRIVPHARTIRKAREQIKCMVADGASHLQTKNYLHRFVMWWAQQLYGHIKIFCMLLYNHAGRRSLQQSVTDYYYGNCLLYQAQTLL